MVVDEADLARAGPYRVVWANHISLPPVLDDELGLQLHREE